MPTETTPMLPFARCVSFLEYQISLWFPNFSEHQKDAPERLIKTQITRCHPQVSESVMGQGLRMCLSNNFPGDADTDGGGTIF